MEQQLAKTTVVFCLADLVTTIQVDMATQLLIAASRNGYELTQHTWCTYDAMCVIQSLLNTYDWIHRFSLPLSWPTHFWWCDRSSYTLSNFPQVMIAQLFFCSSPINYGSCLLICTLPQEGQQVLPSKLCVFSDDSMYWQVPIDIDTYSLQLSGLC